MSVRTTRLGNGLTVVTDHMAHLKSIALGVWVNAGSRSEYGTEHGLAHLLEHMAFKGTTTRTASDIAVEIEAVGGELNAATSIENTAYYARILSDDLVLAVDILSDILQNSVLDPEELEKEKHVILQEIGASLDMPEDLVFDRFQETAFQRQAIGRPILGTPESVSSFEVTAISNYLARNYKTGDIIISAAGEIDHDLLVSLVDKYFAKLPEGKAGAIEQARYVGGERIEDRPLQEAQILIGFEGCSYKHPDFFAIQFLATILGGGMSSRLFQEVREKRGLCYSVSAFHWAYSDTGLFGIHAATGAQDVCELMPVVLDEISKLAATLTETEVERAKSQMRAGLLMSLESPASRASQLARHVVLFGQPITMEEQIARINAVTIADIKRLATRIFTTSRPTLSAIGPVGNILSVDDIVARLHIMQAAE